MPPVIVPPISQAEQPYEKLDPRLAALLELEDRVFEPADEPGQAVAAPPASGGHESMRGAGGRRGQVRQRRSGPLAFLTGPRSFVGTFEPARGGHEAARFSTVAVFVTARSPAALDSIAQRACDIVWRGRAGRVATTDVHPAQLAVLEKDPDVVAVEWTGGAKPKGPVAGGRTAARARRGVSPRAAVGLGEGAVARGEGVVVGIVDAEGIDIYHPAFTTARGTNRIRALWDQALPCSPGGAGEVPSPYGYGTVYTPRDVHRELDGDNRDRYSVVGHVPLKLSHGTMVAGVAAGGEGEDPALLGVAPGADIVFVSTQASGAGALAAMTEIAEAVDFVFREAGDRPCVVNVSLGDELGPRDGTSPVERFVDELLAERPGRAVVVSAGNEHEARRHASGVAAGGGEVVVVCEAHRHLSRHAVIEIWYGGVQDGEAGISVQIESPGGACATALIPPDGLGRAFDLGETRLIVASVKRYPGNGDALIRVEMFPRTADGAMDRGEYRLKLTGDGARRPFHAALDHTAFRLRVEGVEGVLPPITLASPATCRSAVTVGACDHARGLEASFSSRGPDRGGVVKPEVLACGVTLRAPAAATLSRAYDLFTGTSAAAPLVTGAIALAFEHARRCGRLLAVEETFAFVRAAGCGEARRLLLPPDGRLAGLFEAAGIRLGEGTGAEIEHRDSARSRGVREAPMNREKENEGEIMSAQDTKTAPRGRDLVREKDGKQVGIGFYTLIQNSVQTGRLLVVEENDKMIEHWDLWSGFRQPSWGNTSQEIVFEYVSEPISLSTFRSNIGQNSTYIVASCEQVFL